MKSTQLLGLGALLVLSACGTTAERLANIGRVPDLSPITNVPTEAGMPSLASPRLPRALPTLATPSAYNSAPEAASASLWRTGARAFFKDQRASTVGDIVTVRINIADKAEVGNTTTRTRSNTENAQLPALLGLESQLSKLLPEAISPSNLVSGGTQSKSSGNGEVQRKETIELTVAALITGTLPNGNLVIQGRQEVRVNFEVRELVIAGIIRPQDISRTNEIQHTQIAEARISYGGRGQLSDVQQARYGQQIYDALFPF